ncbi:MAG: ArsC family reductase [Burkholderiales bacterium]|nr:ArsC family reductase [Burkholderiales bacterium]
MASKVKLYGIKNCDTVKKARAWLAERGIEVPFHDFKSGGISGALIDRWEKALGWEALLNRRGTTWRTLPDPVKERVADSGSAKKLMLEKPTVIKRPVLELGDQVHIGFSPDGYQQLFP